jgi:hypothetical protein
MSGAVGVAPSAVLQLHAMLAGAQLAALGGAESSSSMETLANTIAQLTERERKAGAAAARAAAAPASPRVDKRARSDSADSTLSEGSEVSGSAADLKSYSGGVAPELHKQSKRRAQIAAASRKSRAKRKVELSELQQKMEQLEAANAALVARESELRSELSRARQRHRECDNDAASACSSVATTPGEDEPAPLRAPTSLAADPDLAAIVKHLTGKAEYFLQGVREDALLLLGKDLPADKKERVLALGVYLK